MKVKTLLAASTIAAMNAAVSSVNAAPFIVVGGSNLQPNQANQQIQLLVSGTDQVAGVTLYAEMDPISGIAPAFSNANLLSGTIFAANNTGEKGKFIGTGTLSNFLTISTTTSAGTVNLSGTPALLVTLTVNTTGIPAGGLFHLSLNGTLNGNSFFVLANDSKVSSTYASNLFSVDTAANRQWNSPTGGAWASDNNWTPFAPYAAGDQANFLGMLTTGTVGTITLNGDRVAGSVLFNNTSAQYNIAQGTVSGMLRLNGISPSITDAGGNHIISAPVALSADTAIAIPGATSTLTISGAISGSSNVSLTGSGRLVLSGANSFANASVGTGATLQFATSAAANSAGTTYTNNGNLFYTQTDNSLITVAIIGSGTLTQAGTGTTTLLGANTYTGPTNINSGTLMIGNNGTTGTLGTGLVTNSGALVFNRTNALSISAGIAGTGSLSQANTGTTTLNGNSYTATGPVTVSKGTLAIGTTTNTRNAPGVMVKIKNLTIASNANLDLTNHDFMIGNTTLAKVDALVLAGFGAGNPGDPQISSSTALANGDKLLVPFDAAANGITSWDGVNVTEPNTVITKFTWAADANFDGMVDFNDYAVITGNYGASTTALLGINDFGGAFLTGDLNLDGKVDFNDYAVVTGLYGKGVSGPLGALDTGATPSIGGVSGGSAVPEPATLFLLGLGGICAFQRRRKSR